MVSKEQFGFPLEHNSGDGTVECNPSRGQWEMKPGQFQRQMEKRMVWWMWQYGALPLCKNKGLTIQVAGDAASRALQPLSPSSWPLYPRSCPLHGSIGLQCLIIVCVLGEGLKTPDSLHSSEQLSRIITDSELPALPWTSLSAQACSFPSPQQAVIPRGLPNKPPPCWCVSESASWGPQPVSNGCMGHCRNTTHCWASMREGTWRRSVGQRRCPTKVERWWSELVWLLPAQL